ncbi:MAG: hypothetical protein KKI08_08635, partial [Armatimonadetes bacterium]|nr:hypothetical protein [Armatimonadota bacterium]
MKLTIDGRDLAMGRYRAAPSDKITLQLHICTADDSIPAAVYGVRLTTNGSSNAAASGRGTPVGDELTIDVLRAARERRRGAGAEPLAAEPTVKVGTDIVAATSKTSFRQGKVFAIEGSRVTFEYGTENENTKRKPTWTVDGDKVWLMTGVKDATAGDALVCRTGTESWYPCRVDGVEGAVVKIQDSYGKQHNLSHMALLRPDEATQADVKDYLAREAKRRAFDQAFLAAGRPVRPPRWAPKKGDKVVIQFVGTSWYSGTVVEMKKDSNQATIDWEGDT